ncbi:MAG: hypothetical protein HZB53_03875 [Chloroflexi bacterium]|nr:hypothetical protein [Chloroflexota bacterium]
MSEENKQSDPLSWEDHFKAGMDGLKAEMRETMESRETLNTVRKHGKAALKEALLAWRSLLDGAIEKIDENEKGGPQRVTKIKIE